MGHRFIEGIFIAMWATLAAYLLLGFVGAGLDTDYDRPFKPQAPLIWLGLFLTYIRSPDAAIDPVSGEPEPITDITRDIAGNLRSLDRRIVADLSELDSGQREPIGEPETLPDAPNAIAPQETQLSTPLSTPRHQRHEQRPGIVLPANDPRFRICPEGSVDSSPPLLDYHLFLEVPQRDFQSLIDLQHLVGNPHCNYDHQHNGERQRTWAYLVVGDRVITATENLSLSDDASSLVIRLIEGDRLLPAHSQQEE